MNRRLFLKTISGAACSLMLPGTALGHGNCTSHSKNQAEILTLHDLDIKDYLHRMANFDSRQHGDIILDERKKALLKSSVARLKRLQRTVGFGNFYLLGFDAALAYSRNYSSIGKFTKEEKDFLEEVFHTDAALYGFMGEKPLTKMTATISGKDVFKVPGTGNYLYKGQPRKTYEAIRRQLGRDVLLTSGVRGVMKQFLLFLDKAVKNGGNLSLASRSLAPPGYSFHGIGDFDVGERGLGAANFSIKFTGTPTCKKLQELGYLKLRYPQGNMLGVRFEPWHIKVGETKA